MLQHRLIAEVCAVVVVGELRLPPADAVHQRHAKPIVGTPQVAVVLRIEPHEGRSFDLHLEALRMEHGVRAKAEDRSPAAERGVPQRAVASGWIHGICRGIVVPGGADARLLRPRQIAGVDEVVWHQLPKPWPRRPEVVEALRKSSSRQRALVWTVGCFLVGHIENNWATRP